MTKNEKISIARKLSAHKPVINICQYCGKSFSIKWNKRYQKHCCRSCSAKSLSTESRKQISEKMIGKNSGENNAMYGKSPKNTKSITVFSEKHTNKKEFNVRSSHEKRFIDIINQNNDIIAFTYEPQNFKVKYVDEKGINRTYQPDFLLNDNKITEIKNRWNVTLKETKIKEAAFRKQFPLIEYEIVFW